MLSPLPVGRCLHSRDGHLKQAFDRKPSDLLRDSPKLIYPGRQSVNNP